MTYLKFGYLAIFENVFSNSKNGFESLFLKIKLNLNPHPCLSLISYIALTINYLMLILSFYSQAFKAMKNLKFL
jgi:hypothetical protein